MQGRSLKGAIEDPTHRVHEEVYCLRKGGHLLRTARWAFISWGKGGEELYDMEKDPRQYANLVKETEHGGTLKKMRLRLEAKLAAIMKK